MQKSFASGEWAPNLNARVDIQKYHSGAALLENFFVDYRGGVSTRPGTKYILQCYRSDLPVRLVRFQASFTVSYVLEFGQNYIRFFNNQGPVVEAGKSVVAISATTPTQVTINAHGYHPGEWVFFPSVPGVPSMSNAYFIVNTVVDANNFTITDLFGAPFGPVSGYTGGAVGQRVYTLSTPYLAQDLALLKFAQNVSTLEICHPNYPPALLTLISATDWTLVPNKFGSTINPPIGVAVATTLAAGTVNYAYVVTAVDVGDQESGPSAVATLLLKADLRSVLGTNTISWTAQTGASFYNVYKTELSYAGAPPIGAAFGFIGYTNGTSFADSNIAPDFQFTPPIVQNPFQGSGLAAVTVTDPSTYTVVPTVTIADAPVGGQTATAQAVLQVQGTPVVGASVAGNLPGDSIAFPNGIVAIVATITAGSVTAFQPITFPGSNPGAVTSGSVPSNPLVGTNTRTGVTTNASFVWGVGSVNLTSPGAGYTSVPTVTFSPAGATAIAVLTTPPVVGGLGKNPAVPQYFQQRLALMGPNENPQQFDMSKPGAYFNFDISNPIQPDDAIQGVIVSGQLNTIKSAISMPNGLIVLTDQQAWLINGGTSGAFITPINATAQGQAYNGASDVPPIVANFDIIYVQSKGSILRDLTFNFYTNIYTGTDITVLSSHLFFGKTISEMCWAEEPFKVLWAVRSDGVLLALTYVKEQDLIGWTHHITTNGLFKSTCSVTEQVSFGSVDAPYFVVERVIQGQTLKYIERLSERFYPNKTTTDAWTLDCAIQYLGSPATTFFGATHLAGQTVTVMADGIIQPSFVMPATGIFTLAAAASNVKVGLKYDCILQTLRLDTGEPTIQGKRKSINGVTVRTSDTAGLVIGKNLAVAVTMKDFVPGNVGSASNRVVQPKELQTVDARTIIDPSWDVQGQYTIAQTTSLPATILGVIPEIGVGDT
jgi:hypothetical protein